MYIQIRLAEITGIGLVNQVEKETDQVYLNITFGNIAEEPDEDLTYRLTLAQARFMKACLSGRSKKIFNIKLENEELRQLVHHLDVYFKYHIEGYQERKSDSIFEKMLQA